MSDVTLKRPSSVLFACSMNAVRSPMAEGLAKFIVGRTIFVDSAGLNKQPLDTFALTVMREIGVDISEHRTKAFDDVEVESFDLIIALSPEAYERAQAFARTADVEVEYWPTSDPTASGETREQRLEAYRGVRDHLRRRIRERLGPPAGD
ncbi:MAG: arsenate reductase ArsC [Beijerinckiaceae bacterium]|nr:arsenate reductase ArsC [Beijerinckiaceae bacterium]